MFKKILVANGGEIACRVFGSARRVGIATDDADADAALFAKLGVTPMAAECRVVEAAR